MEKQTTKHGQKGKKLIVLGFTSIAILFLLYARLQNAVVTPDAIPSIERLALGFYIVLLLSFGAIFYGLYRYHKQKVLEKDGGILSTIAIATYNTKSRKIFALAFVAYGIFFSLTSGTLVYQPEVVFSEHYGAVVPSAHITPCCGDPGYMPKFIVYFTEHVGLQIIPINLLLQIIVSYLVGLNASLAVNAISIAKKEGGLSSVGAATGLFIACPTCVGTLLSVFISTSSVLAFTVVLTQLQTLLIAITIPVLFFTPVIMARKLRRPDGSCAVNPS
jgi:hypothetical protein